MKVFDYVDASGADFALSVDDKDYDEMAKKIAYENIIDDMRYKKIDTHKIDAYTVKKVLDTIIDSGWIDSSLLVDEEQMQDAFEARAIEYAEARHEMDDLQRDWQGRCRV